MHMAPGFCSIAAYLQPGAAIVVSSGIPMIPILMLRIII